MLEIVTHHYNGRRPFDSGRSFCVLGDCLCHEAQTLLGTKETRSRRPGGDYLNSDLTDQIENLLYLAAGYIEYFIPFPLEEWIFHADMIFVVVPTHTVE